MLDYYRHPSDRITMPLITSQNAAEMAQRSHEARKMRKLAEATKAAIPHPSLQDADSYLEKRLTRGRGEVESLSDLLDKEKDPQRIDRLCSGLARLCELERVLAMRPLPGSMKPSKDSKTRCRPQRDLPDGPETA